MKKIFVDMDGVITDFNKKYTEMFGRTPAEVRADRINKQYSEFWHLFVDRCGFEKLDWHEGGQELICYLEGLKNVQICILTSAGGFDRHPEVQEQKLNWLRERMVDWPAVVVPGRRFKSGFASSDAFMIDDTPDVITGFCDKGGYGILHTDVNLTIDALSKWLV